MCLLPQDERHLARALTLAAEAASFASPNPAVGCVLVRDQAVLGEGAHVYDARDHAEIAALKNAASQQHSVQGATAFVTLEPCSHTGRTGPCADALIAAGIAHCVVATVDPNPQVRGSGIARLRAAGIKVTLLAPQSPLAQRARRLNDAFAFSIQHNRPFVTLKAALSVDGKLAPPPHQRASQTPHWLTGPAARADVQQLRHQSDAILTGIGTILADNPSLTDRTGLPRRRPLLRIVLDTHLRTPLTSELANTARGDLLLVTGTDELLDAAITRRWLDRGVELVGLPAADGFLDLSTLLQLLHNRGIRSLLVEAGSTVNASFLAADLVDHVVLYYAETELGEDALPFARGIGSPYLLQQQLLHVQRTAFPHAAAEDIRLSGYMHDPWEGVA